MQMLLLVVGLVSASVVEENPECTCACYGHDTHARTAVHGDDFIGGCSGPARVQCKSFETLLFVWGHVLCVYVRVDEHQ